MSLLLAFLSLETWNSRYCTELRRWLAKEGFLDFCSTTMEGAVVTEKWAPTLAEIAGLRATMAMTLELT